MRRVLIAETTVLYYEYIYSIALISGDLDSTIHVYIFHMTYQLIIYKKLGKENDHLGFC